MRHAEGHQRKFIGDIVLPFLGFLFCTVIWVGLGTPAKVAGGLWFIIGVFVLASHTHGFREPLALPDPATYE